MTREALIEAMARAIAREAGHDPDVMIPGATKEAGRIWRQFIGAATASLSAIEASGAVVVPNSDNMNDEQAEAVAMQANCCGGIALDIYTAALAASPYRSAE